MQFINFLGSIAAIVAMIIACIVFKLPSITSLKWTKAADLYGHPCDVLTFTFQTSVPGVRVLSVSLPGYKLRPRECQFAFTTSDPSVVSIDLESVVGGCAKKLTFDCFELGQQSQDPKLSLKLQWHSLTWSINKRLRRTMR